MPRPPHVAQDKIDDAMVTAIVASRQEINIGEIVRATETIEAATAERKYFCEPANAANIGRLEALGYAWTNQLGFRKVVLLFGVLCTLTATLEMMGQPWPLGISRAMQAMGFLGIFPTLHGAIPLHSRWSSPTTFVAYQFRAAPILLTVGASLIAIGLVGTWLT